MSIVLVEEGGWNYKCFLFVLGQSDHPFDSSQFVPPLVVDVGLVMGKGV
jgi:hypothetical protein